LPIKNLLEDIPLGVFMDNSNLFDEDENLEMGTDENTIIVESWLDFVAARGENDNPSSSKALNEEIKDKIQELCVRIDAMLEERKLFCAELERMTKDDSLADAANELLPDFPLTKPHAFLDADSKSDAVLSSACPLESKRLFLGRKTATNILQLLKISPKSRTNLT
jgi:hypothetical protein